MLRTEQHSHAHPDWASSASTSSPKITRIIASSSSSPASSSWGWGHPRPLVRIQLAWPHAEIPILHEHFRDNAGRMSEATYNMLFSMPLGDDLLRHHPVLTGAFGNFTIPLMIGAPDMAFPKLNMMSVLDPLPAFVMISFSFFVDGGAGILRLDLLSDAIERRHEHGEGLNSPAAPGSGHGQVFWLASLLCVGVGSMMGSVNYITTIITCALR